MRKRNCKSKKGLVGLQGEELGQSGLGNGGHHHGYNGRHNSGHKGGHNEANRS